MMISPRVKFEKFGARNKIILDNLGLATKLVWRYKGLIDPMDIVGICNLGLVIAAEKNVHIGTFENYAYKYMKGLILRASKKTSIISIPEYKWKDKECRERSKVFLEESLANDNEDGDGLSMASFKGKEPTPDLIVMAKDELKKIINEIQEILDFIVGCGNIKRKKKAEIFKARYGLLDGSLEMKTLDDIANTHNITREGARLVLIRLWEKITGRFPQKDEEWLKHQIERFGDMLDFMSDDDIETLNLNLKFGD